MMPAIKSTAARTAETLTALKGDASGPDRLGGPLTPNKMSHEFSDVGVLARTSSAGATAGSTRAGAGCERRENGLNKAGCSDHRRTACLNKRGNGVCNKFFLNGPQTRPLSGICVASVQALSRADAARVFVLRAFDL